jgi:glycosyltransferase involved in cell wall biosynthesis
MERENFHIAVITDMDQRGSGYMNIMSALCTGLATKGYDIKIAGLGYQGEEHLFPFSIIPAQNIQETLGIIQNLFNLWREEGQPGFDALIVALDIPLQERIIQAIGDDKPFKYIGIMPVEADPLCLSWAMVLMQMDKCLIISEFGANEARKVGVDAEHIQIGIDTESWRLPEKGEKKEIRKALGIDEEAFVVLTVADNQERKFLSRAMEIYSGFAQDKTDTKYILVTREHNKVGWKLRDLAQELKISDKLMIFERGMSFTDLWMLYIASDVFLLTSKAEGLGMPLLEAMATGVIVLGTSCTAIRELINKGNGFLIRYDYSIRDPFGNGRRYYADRENGIKLLEKLYWKVLSTSSDETKQEARKYVETRQWSITIDQLDKALQEALSEK